LASARQELRLLGIPPLRRFGQHFLLSENVRDKLVHEAHLTQADIVVEVGPGLGFLTAALASRAGRVIAIERDRTLVKHLERKFSANNNVDIIEGDALATPLPANAKIVSSPPYNISSKLILRIIKSDFKLACLLLQEDFINRLTAPSGSRDYGRLTVVVQTHARAEYVSHVPKLAFYPPPRVDSAIVTVHPTLGIMQPKNTTIHEDLVRALFTQRRRKVRGVLSRYLMTKYGEEKEEILSRIDLEDKRVYELTPIEFIRLSNVITGSVKS